MVLDLDAEAVMMTMSRPEERSIPAQFVWPAEERAPPVEEMAIPVVDLAAFLLFIPGAPPPLPPEACERHGFFQVVNHGVGGALIAEAYRCCDAFFHAGPLADKQRARRRPGESQGYASSFAGPGRFRNCLPWKETLSFNCPAGIGTGTGAGNAVVDYFVDVLGEEYRHMGEVYQEYCDAMTRLALDVTEVLAAALGLRRGALRGFFTAGDGGGDSSSIMRLNHYPSCPQPHLALGTGPHRDPTSLTLLHQDHVGGLQVRLCSVDVGSGECSGEWRAVRPRADAFVVNVGDTFAALTDGRHASCLHRAVVSAAARRSSLAFFLNPPLDRVVRPPDALVLRRGGGPRAFPDFTWREFLEFTQKQYRSDASTMDAFVSWIAAGGGRGGDDHGGHDDDRVTRRQEQGK